MQDPRLVFFTPPASGDSMEPQVKRYWADYKRNAIMRSNKDGSNVETLSADAGLPYGISQDPETGLLLWTSSEREVVHGTRPDGQEKPLTLVSAFAHPFMITVADWERDIAYGVHEGRIVRVRKDRYTGVEQLDVLLTLASPDAVHGLAMSPDQQVLYLGDSDGRMSQRLDLSSLKCTPLSYEDPVGRSEPPAEGRATPSPLRSPSKETR